MKTDNRLITALLLLVPVFVLGFITIGPYPFEMAATWQKARLAAAQQKFAEAANLYRTLVQNHPERTDLYNIIADLEFQDESYANAAEAYQKAEAANVITNEGLFNLGISLQKQGLPQTAIAAWRKLIDRPGLDSAQFSSVVGALREDADLDGALLAARVWNENFKQDVGAAYTYGTLLAYIDQVQSIQILSQISTGSTPEAKKAQVLLKGLETAVGSDQQEYGLVVVGQRLLEIREYDLAEQAFIRAVKINAKYAEAWAMLSEVEQSLGKDGWQSLQTARQLNPKSDLVRAELALYYRRQNKSSEALVVLEELSADHPNQASWVIEIGSALAAKGDLIAAMNAYERATELEPENPVPWRALAAFAAENGFDAESYSIPAAQKAVSLDDKDAQSLDLLGWIWLIEGDLEKAEQFLQQALEQDANNPQTVLHLAQLYLERNNRNTAYKFLQQVINQNEDPSAALQAGRLLEKYFPTGP